MESSGNLSYNKGVKSDKNWVIEESRFSRRELKKTRNPLFHNKWM